MRAIAVRWKWLETPGLELSSFESRGDEEEEEEGEEEEDEEEEAIDDGRYSIPKIELRPLSRDVSQKTI